MTNIREERLRWKHGANMIDKQVDGIVEILNDNEMTPVGLMAVDLVFRPFCQWAHSAQVQDLDATTVRNAAIHLVNVMLIELMSRMVEKGDRKAAIEWVDSFMQKLDDEVIEDLRRLYERKMDGGQ